MKPSFKSLLLLLTTALLYNCKPLKTLLNREFPPLTTVDQQYTSIEHNLSGLENFKPHIGINIEKNTVIRYVLPELKKAVDSLNNETVTIQNFEPTLSFEKQGIFIAADFSITLSKEHAKIKGHFTGATTVSTQADSLYLRSAISSLNIHSIRFTKKTGLTKRALAKLIAPVLKNYIENINGELFKKPTVIYVGWGETYKLSLKDMFKDPKIEIIADSIKLSRFIRQSSIRLKTNGISVMLELADTKPTLVPSATVILKPRTESEMSRLFTKFNDAFDTSWLTTFEAIDPKVSVSSSISKAEIAGILNEALSKPITMKQAFLVPESTFDQKLEVKKEDIDCQKVRTDFSYPDFNGASCDWDCTKKVCVLGKCVYFDDPACLASRAACRTKREAERVLWQAARETARIAHQAENEAKVGACNLQRELTGLLALGKFKGAISGSGKASVHFNSFHFNEDLSEITLNYSGDVNAKLKSNLELKPVDLGYIFFCYGNYDKTISSDIALTIPQASSKISITSSREDENLNLHIKLDKISYNASIEPSPLHVLLKDPVFHAQCPISTILGIGAGATAVGKLLKMVKLAPEQELLLMGKAKGEYGIDEMQIPFKPITFNMNGESKKSLIFWNRKSIQFTYTDVDLR